MRNKANFRKNQMNVNNVLTKDYENKPRFRLPTKQTQNKANQPQSPAPTNQIRAESHCQQNEGK